MWPNKAPASLGVSRGSMISIHPPQDLIVLQIFDASAKEVAGVIGSEVLADWPGVTHRDVEDRSVMLPVAEYNPRTTLVHVWEPAGHPGSTVVRASIQDGWPSLRYAAVRRHAWSSVKIRVSGGADAWPICELNYVERGQECRFLRAMKDDPRWQFLERGDPLSFEETTAYLRRRIRDRFTPEMLWSYVALLGWDSSPDALWKATQCSVFHVPSKANLQIVPADPLKRAVES